MCKKADELDSIARLAMKARKSAIRIEDNFLQYLIDLLLLQVGHSIAILALDQTCGDEQESRTKGRDGKPVASGALM